MAVCGAARAPALDVARENKEPMIPLFAIMTAALCAAPEGLIAFVGGTSQEDQCVQMLDARTGLVVRVGPGQRDGAPRWSPDGQWLAFETQQPDGLGICVARADASERHMLRHARKWNRGPRWSADGRRLIYCADADMGMQQTLMVYDLASGTESAWAGERAGMMQPVWLPHLGLLLAIDPDIEMTLENFDYQAFVDDALTDGMALAIGLLGEPGSLTTEPLLTTRNLSVPFMRMLSRDSFRHIEWGVSINPKGDGIAFESDDGGFRDIFVISRRGLNNVSNHHAADWNPVWSNDSKWVAFESFRGGRRGIYRVFYETARIFPVAEGTEHDCWSPSWGPDDAWIAYVSSESGHPELYAIDVESGEQRKLTSQPGYCLAPAWYVVPKQ